MNNNINVGANLFVRPKRGGERYLTALCKSPYGGDSGGLLLPLFPFLFLLLFSFGCKEEGRIDHIDDNAPAPAQVTNVRVQNTPGGAILRYALPEDKNLLYVKAEYEIQPGVTREAKSSYFKDTLVLDGFGSTDTYDVRLYSVGKNEKMSAPVIIPVNPLTPPVLAATKRLRETFGGVAIDIENPASAGLAIVLLADTAKIGYLSELHTFYSSMPKGSYSFRGLDTIPRNYAVYLRDRWNNLSDTIYSSLTPWFEEFIPKNTWQEYTLPGDAPLIEDIYYVRNIWDNRFDYGGGEYISALLPLPQMITWDLGVTVKLGRFKLWPRFVEADQWKRSHVKEFEIWGSNMPNMNGSLDDSWIPLGRFETVKPSGPGPTITQEDIDLAYAGFDYDFEVSDFAPNPNTPVRYIRFRTLSTFHNTNISSFTITEMNFWGSIVK